MINVCRNIVLKTPLGLLAIAAVLYVVASRPPVGVAQTSAICTFPFYAQVFQGPNTGMVLKGNVTLSIEPSGNAFGILSEDSGTQVGIVGQVTGRTLSMLLSLDAGQVSAMGVADDDVRGCGFKKTFGPLVGPAIDDSGSWGVQPPCLPYPACRS